MELHRAADMFIVSNAKLPSPGPIIYSFIMLSFLPIWIVREKVKATMPLKFQRCCQNVTVMLDCLAIAQETSSSLTLKSQTFSNCKIRMTLKGLMGVSPSGLEFISPLYTVCISDKEMTSISGVLPWLEPGDQDVADKGLLIQDLLADVGAKLFIPPFKRSGHFSKLHTLTVIESVNQILFFYELMNVM